MALGLFQTQVDSVRRVEIAQTVVTVQVSQQARIKAAKTAEERRRFERDFNRLVSALDDFQREYNASGGQIWPKKQADALKRALKSFQVP